MVNAEMKRFNLTHPMHCWLMGNFLDMRCSMSGKYEATKAALIARGLLDAECNRTPLALEYIQEHCNKRDVGILDRNPGVGPLIYDLFGLYLAYLAAKNDYEPSHKDANVVSIYVHHGHTPMVSSSTNRTTPLGLISSRFMWGMEVGKNKPILAKYFNRYSVSGATKMTYGYSISPEFIKGMSGQTATIHIGS